MQNSTPTIQEVQRQRCRIILHDIKTQTNPLINLSRRTIFQYDGEESPCISALRNNHLCEGTSTNPRWLFRRVARFANIDDRKPKIEFELSNTQSTLLQGRYRRTSLLSNNLHRRRNCLYRSTYQLPLEQLRCLQLCAWPDSNRQWECLRVGEKASPHSERNRILG